MSSDIRSGNTLGLGPIYFRENVLLFFSPLIDHFKLRITFKAFGISAVNTGLAQ